MSGKPIYDCPLYTIEQNDDKVVITFKSASVASVFMQMDFFSKLLSSYQPDTEGIWRPSDRTTYEIVGWPKQFKWQRTSDKTSEAIADSEVIDLVQYGEVLEKSMTDILVRTEHEDGGLYYHFSVADEENVHQYSFNDRARVIAALCVLYDLEAHPRNHLEINIPVEYVQGLKWPMPNAETDAVIRYYGDPSKTADVLRNEGWTREGQNAHMFVFREYIHGQQQQMYKIDTREQTLNQQVKRTAIKPIWRKKLFELQDYTCRICLNNYSAEPEQLSPDHRVPVIFAADNLTDENFSEKLMTLCRYCNQQKREFCKRISDGYNWETSPWAYPEKYRLDRIQVGIEEYASQNSTTPSKVVEQLAQHYRGS